MAETTVWRLTHRDYKETAFSGRGSRRYGGRFNSRGTPVVYTSESLALALLETLTGLQRYDQLHSYVFFRVALPDDFVAELSEVELPTGWGSHPPSEASRKLGDDWAHEKSWVALRVPSVVVPYSYNYALNSGHPSFERVEAGDAESLPVDERLVS